MKKIIAFITTIICSTLLFTSCLKEHEGPTATVNYVGLVNKDSIYYTVPEDSVWERNIIEALAKLEITEKVFEVSDSTVSPLSNIPVEMCDWKAGKIYDDMLKKANLNDVKKAIYNAHADSLIRLGYVGSDAIPLQKFNFKSTLYSYYSGKAVFYYYTDVR